MEPLSDLIPSLTYPEISGGELGFIFSGEYDIPLNRAPRTVLDIGAHCGFFSLWARKRWPKAHITAYEAAPVNVGDLRWNCDRYGINTMAMAVAGHTGHVRFAAGFNRLTGFIGNALNSDSIEIQCISSAAIGSAEFVKIDTEGAEADIIEHLDTEETLAIAVEVHSPDLEARCIEMLTARGFDLVCSRDSADNGCKVLKFRRPDAAPSTVPTVFLGMPVYTGYHPFFVNGLIQTIVEQPCNLMIRPMVGDSLVSRARNRLAATFLETDATHLLFLDTDLVFSPDHIKRLLSHREAITCGLYPKKQPVLAWVFNSLPGQVADNRGLLRCKYAGTGCMLIERQVIERMRDEHPELAYDADDGEASGGWDFFSVGVWKCPITGRRRYLSEDWFFCQRALDLGFPIHMDMQIVLKHVGDCVYPLIDPFKKQEPTVPLESRRLHQPPVSLPSASSDQSKIVSMPA